jgi:uncharacterized protein
VAPQALREQTAEVPLGADGSLRLAVVADTHSRPHPRAAALLSALRPDAILHAGDIGDLEVLDGLRAIAPLFAIRGNIDARAPHLPELFTVDLTRGETRVLRILVMHIAVNGPRLRADAVRLARARGADLVVCGHSHLPFIGRDRGLGVFNPGSIGPRRFALPIVFGTIDVDARGVHMAHVDAETGVAWSP